MRGKPTSNCAAVRDFLPSIRKADAGETCNEKNDCREISIFKDGITL